MGIRKKSNEINNLEFLRRVFVAGHVDASGKALRPFFVHKSRGEI
jgi:hypothetical protein